MTINDIINQINADLQDNVNIPYDQELTQDQLNSVTDQIALTVDTVNPDREYPKVIIR